MTLNLKSENSFYVFDEYGMLTVKLDELSWQDSIGMTVCAWIAYGRPEELAEAVNNCTVFGDPWNLLRHPNHPEEFASRDHFSYWTILQKLNDSNYGFKMTIDCLPFMRGFYLWMHSLTGNKWAERAYYMLYIPGAIIGNGWLKFCRWIGRIGIEISNNTWIAGGNPNYGTRMLYERTKWQKLWAWIIFQTIPAYPLHNRGWQLYVMPDSKRKERLKRILLKRVGKSNIMLRLLFEPKVIYNTDYLKSSYKLVTQEEVDSYPHMTGFRPGVYLDETCRRTIRELTEIEAEYNTYEKNLIIYLFKNQNYE